MADENFLDDFLAEVGGGTNDSLVGEATNATPKTPSVAAAISSSFSIDDELADIFGSDTPTPDPNKRITSTYDASADRAQVHSRLEDSPGATISIEAGISSDDNDFMSWLNESPAKASGVGSAIKTTPTLLNMQSNSLLPTMEIPSNNASVDSFFDEVFGEEKDKSAPPSPIKSNDHKLLEKDIAEIVHSSFPDVSQLKDVLLQAGYIPSNLRGPVWSLLLTGSCTEDHEAVLYRPNVAEVTDGERIASDCQAIVSINFPGTSGSASSMERDLFDILALYCVRRQVEYNHLFCNMLVPMLATNQPMSRAFASSCFYSLVSEFVPMVNLQVFFLNLSFSS